MSTLHMLHAAHAVVEAVAAGITHVDFHPGAERDGVARALSSSSSLRSAAAGDAPTQRGSICPSVWFVVQGRVSLIASSGATVSTVEAGQMFGGSA